MDLSPKTGNQRDGASAGDNGCGREPSAPGAEAERGTRGGLNFPVSPDLSGTFKDRWKQTLSNKETPIPEKQDADAGPPTKRLKMEEEVTSTKLLLVGDLDCTKLMALAYGAGKLKGFCFQLCPENKMILVNATAAEVAIAGQLTGWQKGRHWQPKEVGEGFGPAVDLVWKFSSSSEVVLVDGAPLTLFKARRRKSLRKLLSGTTSPRRTHKAPMGPGTLRLKSSMSWLGAAVEGDVKKQSPASLAALIPADAWDLNVVDTVWMARWAKQGLTDIKPVVWLKHSVVVPAEHAVQPTS